MKENIYLMRDVINEINKTDFDDLAVSVLYKRYNAYDIDNPVTIYDNQSFTNAKATLDAINDFVCCEITFPSEDDEMIQCLEELWNKYKSAVSNQTPSSITIPELEFYFATLRLEGKKILTAAHPILMVRSVQPKTKATNVITCLFDVTSITVIENDDEEVEEIMNEDVNRQAKKEHFYNIANEAAAADEQYEAMKADTRRK